jgi:pyruvate dehydrogenase E2 component (dihydrolipoamide acetyltransferase)
LPIEVVIPNLGITVENGIINEWIKNEGDIVEKGEPLFVVEADKVTTEVESPASGVLARILVPVDVEVPLFTVVALIAEPGEEIAEDYLPSKPPPQEAALAEAPAAAVEGASPETGAAPQEKPTLVAGDGRAVPAARKLARDHGLDLTTIAGTGPEGVIQLKDVKVALETEQSANVSTLARRLAAKERIPLDVLEGTGVRGRIMRVDVQRAAQAAAAPGLGKVIPMDTMRKTIARRMADSAFTAPHIYFFTDIWMDSLLKFRKELLPAFENKFDLRPSVNDFLIKAAAMNILEFPMLNAVIRESEIHILPEVNICLAVALPEGLIVPALAHTDRAGLVEIIQQRTDLVERARSGNLSREELDRGTFTISSLAQFDITYFTAILNPPQSGILSVGKTRDELYLDDGIVKTRKMATFGLSVDHRIIDGAVAAGFLQSLKTKLENPAFTFLNV